MASAREKNGRKSKWDTPAPSSGSATEAAHEAARKLNAMLAAKGKLNTNATPPLLPPVPRSTAGPNKDSNASSETFTDEVEINDSPRRLLLCKGTIQYEISKYSGASVSTKGQYIPALERENFAGQKPLYLFIQSSTKEKVNLAVQRIHGLLHGDDPHSTPPVQLSQSASLPSGMHYVQEKIFVGLDNIPPEFNLKEKIVGRGESHFQHITKETGAKVQLRGRGSGFIEPTSGREAFETLYIYISHNSYVGLGAAKKLVENLIQTVSSAFHTFQMQQQPSNNYYSGYGGHRPPPPQQHPMYMPPPVQGYGVPPHPNGPASYPPYPHPSSQYPPRYNQPQQPLPGHHFHHNQQAPPRVFHPNQPPSIHEGPRPLMSELLPKPGISHCIPPARESTHYDAQYPPTQQEPPQFNNSIAQRQPIYERYSETERQSSYLQDEKPTDSRKRRFTEAKPLPPPARSREFEDVAPDDLDPPKRRFIEVQAKKPSPAQPSNPALDKQRSVSSLDRPSSSLSSLLQPSTVGGTFAMPTPLSATKVKPAITSDGFKAPLLPFRSSVSATKNLPPVFEKKQKLDGSETKSTGFALLGMYEDSSDDDDEDAMKRNANH